MAIAPGLPPWAGRANQLRDAHLTLKTTRNSLKETMEWLKQLVIS